MDKRIQQLKEFFNLYAHRFNQALNEDHPDIEGTIQSFADCFIGANPLGVACGKNDKKFKSVLQKGYDFYKKIGITSMDIVSLETSVLDPFHEMTKVRWKSSFVKKDDSTGSIEFENIYFTQTKDDTPKIFAYITGDEQAVLKEHGLIE